MTMPCDIARGDPVHSITNPTDDSEEQPAGTGETAVLRMVAAGSPIADILEGICRSAEALAEGFRCGVYLIDWSGPRIQSFAAPGLPMGFNLALCGLPVHHDAGPCARAACLRMPVIAADLDSDPLWRTSAFRDLAAAHGLKSCWSTPIQAATGEVLGTLAILQDRPAQPTPRHADGIGRLAQIAGIAIEHARAAAAWDKANAELSRLAGVIALGASVAGEIVQPLSGVVVNASTGLRMLTVTPPDVDGVRATLHRTLRDCDRASEMVAQLRTLLGPRNPPTGAA